MALAQIGSLTALMEMAAAAVGAGILLGSFTTGAIGLLLGWPRGDFEARVLRDGYVGGAIGVAAMVVDIVFRYSGG